MKKLSLILFLIMLGGLGLQAQPPSFRHYLVENGLSYNSVLCSVQDGRGFMWFGTKDGLNKFDGYTFKVFRNERGNPSSLGSNFIHSLHVDQQGILWVGTLRGLYSYNALTETFALFAPSRNDDIRDIESDLAGNLWYIAGDNLTCYNPVTRIVRTYPPGRYFNATSICVRKNGEIWVSTTDGFLQQYDARRDTFRPHNVFRNSKPVISNWVDKIYDTGRNSFLIGTSNQGVKLFDIRSGSYRDAITYNQDGTEIYARDFIHRGGDEYWIATESGLLIYNLTTGAYEQLVKHRPDPYALSDNALYTLCKDREGGIWCGTYFGGLNYCAVPYAPFEKFFDTGAPGALHGNAVREITSDRNGKIWVGTEDGGLNRFDPASESFVNFRPTGSSGIAHYNIHGLLTHGNELWIGTFERGLDVMDVGTGRVIRHYAAGSGPNDLKSNFVESIYGTSEGRILIGTSMGVYAYNRMQNNFDRLQYFPAWYHYCAFAEDSSGNLWAGSLRNGLLSYNKKSRKTTSFTSGSGRHSLSNNSINGLFIDSHGDLWIATEHGLCRYRQKTGDFDILDKNSGFPSNVFYKIAEDKKGNLWITTAGGLSSYGLQSKKITNYSKANGLLSDQFNYNSGYTDKQGRMYFGSVNGLVRFNPNAFRQNAYAAPVYLTGFQIYNDEVPIKEKGSPLSQSINFTRKIKLRHLESTFSIDFAALSFTAPEMTGYRYKMEGLEKKWTYLKGNRKVYFTKLAPGRYTFLVRAATGGGSLNSPVTKLEIEVLPPFWLSSWAYLCYFLAGACLFYFLLRNYHRKIDEQNRRKYDLLEAEKEKEVYRAKIEFFTYLTHEIRTPLTLIKGPLEEVMRQAGPSGNVRANLESVEKNTDRLLSLTNQLLDFRKAEQRGFSLSFVRVDIAALLRENCRQFESEAVRKGFSFSLDLPASPFEAYADPEALNKILSNLLQNAFKYADLQVNVSLTTSSQHFEIRITNDGDLIPVQLRKRIFEPFYRISEKESGTGIGLPLAAALTQLHEGILAAEADEAGMNVFVLRLPHHHTDEFEFAAPGLAVPEPGFAIDDCQGDERIKILVVEDQEDIRKFLIRLLSPSYQLFTAATGEEAMSALNSEDISLIVSDVMMPGMNGFTLCAQVKQDTAFTHIPVVLLTARNDMRSRIEGLESGADAYIEKPFSPEHLQKQIVTLLTGRENIRRHFASSPAALLPSVASNRADKDFLDRLDHIIQRYLADSMFDIDQLAGHMNMSRPTLYRKIKAVAGMTPHELMNLTRLKKGAELLLETDFKIYRIAAITGFSSQSQFTRSFQKQFGLSPKDYVQSRKTRVM
ncbi:hybrid sensor histidine kinase/response regulator transcription factor [Pedobacter sp. SYP-B3415]|uniref:hybrid sensor histidine kinase/response regulator transcription factor n=1 Tax=Pedobacter sp. SYP-B3415 TaxID=2496641 RepID=UPI001F102EC9|nr:hybrid sensor histidine kinase/response regulator transcription factor [Pedobacter sp. SYP-B3415]